MSHEQFWSWLYKIGTALFGWGPDETMNADMSDILLAYEGKVELNRIASDEAAEATREDWGE